MKFLADKIRFNKEMDRNEILVIPAPASKCKTCKKNERRDGSSYCQVCADLFKQVKVA